MGEQKSLAQMLSAISENEVKNMRGTTGKGKKVFFITFVLCVLSYAVLIANECTNVWDGLWSGSLDGGFKWCLTIGRWFWPFIGWSRLLISTEPFVSLLTIALYVLSGCLILSMFSLTDSKAAYFVPLSLGVNVTVCISLSYRYMSPTFGMAVLLNVLGIWLLKKWNHWWSWFLAAGSFLLGLGSYQAYVGCALVLFLACIIQMLLQQSSRKSIVFFSLRVASAILLACAVYKILWDVSLSFVHLEPAAYRGANHVTIGNILTHLPQRIKDAYINFFNYFVGNTFPHNAFQKIFLYPAAAMAFLLLSLLPVVRHFRIGKGAAIISLACILCLPLAANFSLLLAPEAGAIDVIMALPMVMIVPVLLCVCFQTEHKNIVLRLAPLLLVSFILYGGFLQSSIEQHTMLHGRQNTISFMDRVVGNLEARDMIHSDNEIIFLGRPSDNPLFKKDELWELSNPRVRYGDLPTANDTCVMSYRGVARDGGYNLPLAEDYTVWHEIAAKPEAQAMPVYPEEGYCQVVDGYLVVKLSD